MQQWQDAAHPVRDPRRPQPDRGAGLADLVLEKRMSGWMIAGLLAGVWLWGQVFGFSESTATKPLTDPKPAASATADR
ncbi:hypothetical protein ABZ281_12885 [Streptomyces sp. NPDC006265]|uniref:hypothetical protein n=1 Tax=Streptomyces sp. NPDC006265 TaxID=3156740 RepID=UPI0033ACC151